jgi:DNA polymerase-1
MDKLRFLKEYIITDKKAYDKLLDDLNDAEVLSVDCETQEFSDETFLPWELELNGIGIYTDKVYGFVVPTVIDKRLDELFLSKKLVMHNAKFDLQVLGANGFSVEQYKFDDTLIMSWLIDENRRTHKLKDLAHDVLKVSTGAIVKFKDLKKKPKKGEANLFSEMFYDKDYQEWLNETASYCMKDCWYTLKLREKFNPMIDEQGLRSTYENVEIPFIGTLRRMERAGVKVDIEYLNGLGASLGEKLEKVKADLHAEVGHEINPNSPVQLKQLFFDQLKYELPDELKNKDGKNTTDVKALDYLADELKSPVAQIVKQFRTFSKLKGTYVEGLLERQRKETIHAGFHHTGTVTGRLSSSNPNLQNIPRKGGEFDIRKAFIARPGRSFVIGDYSQIELRLMAYFSQCHPMIDAYAKNVDIHQITADAIQADRQVGKTLNFSIIYGISPFGFAQRFGFTEAQSKDFINKYFQKYPEVQWFMASATQEMQREGRVRTLAGRWRRFPEYRLAVNLGDFKSQRRVERQTTNSIVQGSAADICKIAMRNLDARLLREKIDAQLLVQVHDELIVECRDEDIDVVSKIVKEEMEGAVNLGTVPLLVEPHVSKVWTK